MLGFVVGLVLVTLFFFLIIGGIVAAISSEEPATVKTNSVLEIDLGYDVPEQTGYKPFEDFSFTDFHPTVTPGVYDIMKAIAKAKDDDDIKGIYLDFGYTGAGLASIEQIRSSLEDFKKSGKFVVAYAELMTERTYYLNSVADKVFLNPKGELEFNGMNAQYMFFKHLLEKIGVEMQIFYNGKYKTATEPFRLDSMSTPNKIMTRALLDDIHSHTISKISASRNIPVAQLDSINDNMLVRSPNDAVKYKIADSTYFVDEVNSYIKNQLHIGPKDKINFISLTKYMNVPGKSSGSSIDDDKIAILFAQGDIIDGRGDEDNIGSEKYVELLKKLREDDKVKAIVFRVNSGGGSALASDVIAREVQLTAAKKTVVVSMGDYAASGGYYIAALATKIVAQPNTLTGSIGVFGILPNAQKLYEDKLGITFDNVKTGKYSDIGVPIRPVREDERMIIQSSVDTIYAQFKAVVVKGRNISAEMVDSIAQGRVWTGHQGLERGLVDTLGGLDDAIKIASKLANSSKYRIVQYPEIKREWFDLISKFADDENTRALKAHLGSNYYLFEQLKTISEMKGVQARMPFELSIQ